MGIIPGDMNPQVFTYDRTFEGFLTLFFDTFEKKTEPYRIISSHQIQQTIFTDVQEVITDDEKASRVWSALQKKISKYGCNTLYYGLLSEIEDIEMLMFRYVKKVLSFKGNYEYNFSDPDVIEMEKIRKKVAREGQRMLMFVRFQKTSDGLFFCPIEPKYNVLPLVTKHFKERYADQKWVIYDTTRKYGFYYDLEETKRVSFDESFVAKDTIWLPQQIIHDEERLFRSLWKEYFHTLAIKERINPRLHMQHLPKRFWKYLPEKQ